MVMSVDGTHDYDVNFEIENREYGGPQNIDGSCGVVYNGEQWILGGHPDQHMVILYFHD